MSKYSSTSRNSHYRISATTSLTWRYHLDWSKKSNKKKHHQRNYLDVSS